MKKFPDFAPLAVTVTLLALQQQALMSNLTEQQIKEYKEAFSIFDKDGDGTITITELSTVLQSLGQNPTEEELEDIIREVDIDGNGEVDFNEFVLLMSKRLKASEHEDNLQDAFNIFDINGTGEIVGTNLFEVLTKLGENITLDEITEMINQIDVNKDGKID